MRHRARPARLHRQRGLRPVQCLTLGLLVKGEDRRPSRRVHVQADDVGALLLEAWIVGDLERLDLPRLEFVIPPDAGDRVLPEPHVLRQRAGRPMRRRVRGLLLLGHPNHLGHRPFRQPRLAAPSRCDRPDPLHPLLAEPLPPGPHGVRRHAAPAGDLLVGHTIASQQQGTGLNHHSVGKRRRTRHLRQTSTLHVRHPEGGSRRERHPMSIIPFTNSATDH